MNEVFPVGRSIVRVGGKQVALREKPLIVDYIVFLAFSDGAVAKLDGGSVEELPSWPEDATEVPIQAPDGVARLAGRRVTAVVMRGVQGGDVEAPRLLLVLDGEAVLAVVPTQQGTVLHTEALLTCPLLTSEHELVSLGGRAVTIDDLVLS
jgi:hypothetical protein